MKLQEAEQSQSMTKDLNWMAKKMQRKMIRTQLLATSFLAKKHHRCLSTRILVETRIWPLAPSENIGSTVCEHCKLGRISWKQRISHSFFYESPYLSHTSSMGVAKHVTRFQPCPRPPARRKRTLNSYGSGRCCRGGKAATTTPPRTPPARRNSNWRGGTLGNILSAKSL